jgi:predicted ATPase
MTRIEGIRIRNFRTLRDVTLGRLRSTPDVEPLDGMTAIIGKNGVGKSSLFDAFGFLADCLKSGVEEACEARGRVGFGRIHSQAQPGPIAFELYYSESEESRPISYDVAVSLDATGRPFVLHERLRQEVPGELPETFLCLENGTGTVWKGESGGFRVEETAFDLSSAVDALSEADRALVEAVEIEDARKLGIATLGSFKQHPRISTLRRFIEGWFLSYFSPDAARELSSAGPQKHLNISGDNLGNVVQFMEREHPERFRDVLARIAERIPGIERIDTERTPDGRLLLRFKDKGFDQPFYAQQMSDGTLKLFAYLLLLEDPAPPPFICIEEPETGLYHKMLDTLAGEFRDHSMGHADGSQVLITTHQPYFVDALHPKEVWVIEKGEEGFSTLRRASDDPVVQNMVDEGLPLGGLWYSDYLDAR